MNKTTFEIINYHLEYYSNRKYIGYSVLQTYNGEYGYSSRKRYIADSDIIINKKKIKKGQEYTTQVIPICGKLKK